MIADYVYEGERKQASLISWPTQYVTVECAVYLPDLRIKVQYNVFEASQSRKRMR